MAGARVTDPELLKLLNGPDEAAPPAAAAAPKPVTDPALLAQLEAPDAPEEPVMSAFPGSEDGRVDAVGKKVVLPPLKTASLLYAPQMETALGAMGRGADKAVRLAANGATLGTIDKGAAYLNDKIKGLFGMSSGYEGELKAERSKTKEAEDTVGPVAAGALKAAGGVGAMAAVAPVLPVFGATAATQALGLGTGLGTRAALSGLTMGAFGAGAGAVNEDDPTKKVESALYEGRIQGFIGAGGPIVGATIGAGMGVAGRLIANRYSPLSYAADRTTRALTSSGRSIDDVAAALGEANAEGSPMMLADTMGYSGRRALAAIAKQPGAGREAIVEALEQRQAGQGQRLSEGVMDAFDSPDTARRTTDGLYKWASEASEPFYQKALAESPVWSERLNEFLKDPISKQGIKRGVEIQRLESLAKGEKFDPHDIIEGFDAAGEPILVKVPNMRTVNVLKKGLDNILDGYRDSTTGRLVLDEKGRAIDQVRRSFLGEVDSLNPEYAKARSLYAGPMEIKDAVAAGKQTGSGQARVADSVSRFQALPDEASQQGFRIGYTDPKLAKLERGEPGINKARRFTSDGAKAEIEAFARPGKAPGLLRRIDRENEMFRTRNAALGGSTTAENLADMGAESGVDAGMLADAVMANAPGLYRRAVQTVANALTGSTEAGRNATAEMLLSRDPDLLRRVFQGAAKSDAQRDVVARALGRGAVNAGASAYRANR